MQLRKLTQEERPQAMALWQYCFGDPEAYTDWYFRRRCGDVLGFFEDRLIAQQATVAVAMDVRGAKKAGFLVSGVATRPEWRGQGLMGDFIRQSYAYMRERGASVASLYPFSYDFYRRFGWAEGCDALRVRADIRQISGGVPEGRVETFDPARAGEECAARCADVYERCFGRYSGHIVRDARVFGLRLEELALGGGHIALYRRGGQDEGYLLYRLDGRELIVEEFGAVGSVARRMLLRFLSLHASTVDWVCWLVPADDAAWRMLSDARKAVTLEPYAMMRIIDIPGAMNGLPAGTGEVVLRVADPHAPWNDGCWKFSGADGRLRTEPAEDADAPALGIGALTQWVFGYRSGSALRAFGAELPQACAARMDALLPEKPVFLYEMC